MVEHIFLWNVVAQKYNVALKLKVKYNHSYNPFHCLRVGGLTLWLLTFHWQQIQIYSDKIRFLLFLLWSKRDAICCPETNTTSFHRKNVPNHCTCCWVVPYLASKCCSKDAALKCGVQLRGTTGSAVVPLSFALSHTCSQWGFSWSVRCAFATL